MILRLDRRLARVQTWLFKLFLSVSVEPQEAVKRQGILGALIRFASRESKPLLGKRGRLR